MTRKRMSQRDQLIALLDARFRFPSEEMLVDDFMPVISRASATTYKRLWDLVNLDLIERRWWSPAPQPKYLVPEWLQSQLPEWRERAAEIFDAYELDSKFGPFSARLTETVFAGESHEHEGRIIYLGDDICEAVRLKLVTKTQWQLKLEEKVSA